MCTTIWPVRPGFGLSAPALPQAKPCEPSVNLSEGVSLPLSGRAITEKVGTFHEPSDARRPEIPDVAELPGDQIVAVLCGVDINEWPGRLNERIDAVGEVPNGVIDVVSVLGLLAVGKRVALHGQKGWDRCDGETNQVRAASRHGAFDGDYPVELDRQFAAVGTLGGEIADERRRVFRNLRVARHQEVDHDVGVGPVVSRGYGANELEAAEIVALSVAMSQEGFDKSNVFVVGEGGRVENEVHIDCADMGHVSLIEEQPGDGAADNRELASEAAEDLPDLDQHGLGRRGGPIGVVGGGLRFSQSHGKHLAARWSADSRSRSLPFQRSR